MKNNNTTENPKRKFAKVLKYTSHYLVFTFVFSLLLSCNTTEPPKPKPEKPKLIELKEVTISCTETFINVSIKDTLLPTNIKIKRNGKEVLNYYQTKPDTVIADTGLTEDKTYIYQAEIENKGEERKSKEIEVSTLPLTSNNFTWKTYTFGNFNYGGGSSLSDVAIIDENDIWAVGEIFADSSGQAYNAVHWDGIKWELKRIFYYGNCSAVEYPPLTTLWAFSKNNIIISNGGSIGWFNGRDIKLDCGVNPLIKGAIKKLWGSSNNDVYAVGNNGSIAHYDGSNWKKIESGTTTNIHDLWGIKDKTTDDAIVLASVSNILSDGDHKVLKLTKNESKEYFGWSHGSLISIWFNSPYAIYLAGAGVSIYKNNTIKKIEIGSNFFLSKIRGTELNDIYTLAFSGSLYHFNGKKWKEISSKKEGLYYGMDVKNNTVVFVGSSSSGIVMDKAVVIIGKRIN